MSDYRFVLMAYPPIHRRKYRSEMTDVANELTAERWSLKQSSSFLAGGLRIRTRRATGGSSREAWASGARVGLLVWLVTISAYGFAATVFPWDPFGSSMLARLLPLAAILAMMVSTRWWVALFVTAIWALPLWVYATNPVIQRASFVETALPLSGAVGLAWLLAVTTDGRRAVSPAVGISLVVAATIASPVVAASVGLEWLLALVLAALVASGLVASSADPRIAATGAVYAALFLPLGVVSGVNSDMWAFFFVFGIALAVAVAASQIGMKRLTNI